MMTLAFAAMLAVLAPDPVAAPTAYPPEVNEVLDRMFDRLDKLEAYTHEAVVTLETNHAFVGTTTKRVSFAWRKPGLLRYACRAGEVIAGPEGFVFHDRYSGQYEHRADGDIRDAVRRLADRDGTYFDVAELILSQNPRKYFEKHFLRLTLSGPAELDGEPCMTLRGETTLDDGWKPRSDGFTAPAILWFRKSDGLLLRIEIDLLADRARTKGLQSGCGVIQTWRYSHEFSSIRTNGEVKFAAFEFQPVPGTREVGRLLEPWALPHRGARPLLASGRKLTPSPDERFPSLKFQNAATVMVFKPVAPEHQDPDWPVLGATCRSLAAEGLECYHVLGRYPERASEEAARMQREIPMLHDWDAHYSNLIDPDGLLSGPFIILVAKDGIVQGMYDNLQGDEANFVEDIKRLLRGESLPAARPLTATEATDYRVAARAGYRDFDDDLTAQCPEDLVAAWHVPAGVHEDEFAAPDPMLTGEVIWIRDYETLRGVRPDGTVVAELPVTFIKTNIGGEMSYAAVRTPEGLLSLQVLPTEIGARLGLIEEEDYVHVLLARDPLGRMVWKLVIPSRWGPLTTLRAGNLNGAPGDEVVFSLSGHLWVVSHDGQVLCRKPLLTTATRVDVRDADRDGRAEVYAVINGLLYRFDYQPVRPAPRRAATE